jgi:hypothetical protein
MKRHLMHSCAEAAFLLTLGGCAHWAYYPVYPASAVKQDGIDVQYDLGGAACGQLRIVNSSAKAVQLVWDEVSAITQDGVQRKAFKGSVRVLDKERAVPPQPIEPGARIEETVCTGIDYVIVKRRPATTMDYAFGWFYGLGVAIANATWKPDDTAKAAAIPDVTKHRYDLVIPLRVADEVVRVRLPVEPNGIGATKSRQ